MSKVGVIIIEGHIQGLSNLRLLGRNNIPAFVIDTSECIAKQSRYCKFFGICPDYDSDEFIEYLIRLNRVKGLQDWILLPSNDHAVYNISRNKSILKDFYTVISEDSEIIERIYNKRLLLSLAEQNGIPIPRTIMPQESNPGSVPLTYPLIIKGNNGLSFYRRYGHKAYIVNRENDLSKVWKSDFEGVDPKDYFIQELIPYVHRTISVTVFTVKGEVHAYWMGVKLREHPPVFGTATCCKSIFDNTLLELSTKLVKLLNYTGVCEIEWLRDSRDNEPKLIEINARTWLWVALAAHCGVNYPDIIYDYYINNLLPVPKPYKLDKIWINLYTDLVFSVVRVIKGLESPKSIIKTYQNFIEACFDIKDPLPFLAYGLLGLKFIRNR